MTKRSLLAAGAILSLALASSADASKLTTAGGATQYAYPAHGQSHSRQQKDEAHCTTWATNQTAFDPTIGPPAQVSGKTKVTGSGARVAGAGAGAVVAGIAGGNPLTGAAVGAVGGGLTKRGIAAHKAKKQNELNAKQYAAEQDEFLKARASCLHGKGYTVK